MRKHALAAAAFFVAIAPLAHAASQASANLSNFKFDLVDLDQFDGVAASYQWVNDTFSGSTSLVANAADQFGDSSGTKNKGQAFFQYGVSGSSDYASAQASVGNLSVAASGAANGGKASFNGLATTGKGGANVLGDLLLAPHSRLTVTAQASVLTSASDPGGTGMDWAKALSSLGLSYSYSVGGSVVNYAFVDSLSSTVGSGGFYDYVLNPNSGKFDFKWVTGAPKSDTRNRDLTVVFDNFSDQAQKATLTLLSSVSGVGGERITAAIPEPDSGLLALAAIGVSGVVSRRTRRAHILGA